MGQILGIIPARFSSTRFPGKPLALINGKPMILRVLERVAPQFEHLCVATDDNRIKTVVEQAGGIAVMTSLDHTTGTERCLEAMEIISSEKGIQFSYIINIQGDEPLIQPEQISDLIECISQPDAEIATLAHPIKEIEESSNPHVVKVVMDKNQNALYFSRAAIPYLQPGKGEPITSGNHYFKHVGLYAYRSDILARITKLKPTALELAESLEQLRWLENGLKIKVKISEFDSSGVDTPEDLERIVRFLNR